jgi:hypothetical protein
MDPAVIEFVPLVAGVVVLGIFAILAMVGASIYSTRLKMKHGYPLEGMWGQKLRPATSTEDGERIRLLSQENAELKAQLGSIKDRLANVERIVTDSGYSLTHQIEALRLEKDKVQ